jgi:hypothetical protein
MAAISLALALGKLADKPDYHRPAVAAVLAFVLTMTPALIPKAAALPRAVKGLRTNGSGLAYNYSQQQPGQIYFPANSLAVLQSEGKLYHLMQGLFTREVCGYPVSQEHFRSAIPPSFKALAVRGEHWYHKTLMTKYLSDYRYEVQLNDLPGFRVFVKTPAAVRDGVLVRDAVGQ